MPNRTESNRKANIWVARTIPLILLAIIGYASWVITRLICFDYLINPSPTLNLPSRSGQAIAILIIYYFLLVILVITYARLLDVVARKPGIVPRGSQWYLEKTTRRKKRRTSSSRQRSTSVTQEKGSGKVSSKYDNLKDIEKATSNGLSFKAENFWHRDVFVCKYDGRPPFCSTCYNWKPDRAHHCSELNRCVMKMDHFCPWVGGVVAEPSFKFFIQFTFYAALFCLEVLVVDAIYFAERRATEDFLNVHWIVLMAVSGLFFIFSAGMCLSSGQFAIINSTTIENLGRKSAVWYLATYISPEALQEAQEKNIQLRTISYPRPPEEHLQILQDSGAAPLNAAGEDGSAAEDASTQTDYRTFVILETSPGQNPWNIGYLRNFQEIMGITIWEWLLPIKPSPCAGHADEASLYKLGSVLEELKRATGIKSWTQDVTKSRKRRRKSRT